jgi:hypothetical protein
LSHTDFVNSIKVAIDKLDRSPGALVVVGVDGPQFSEYDRGDQLCVAVDKTGVIGIGRKIFPVAGDEADALLCHDADFGEHRRVVRLASGRKAILAACYDMFGIAERGDIKGIRARFIQWIGTYKDQVGREERCFRDRLEKNLADFGRLLTNDVTIGLAAIHSFQGHATGFWQRHGIASCSAALGSGFAVGAAHFGNLPKNPMASTLAADRVPETHLKQGVKRKAHSLAPKDQFLSEYKNSSALVRLFSS